MGSQFEMIKDQEGNSHLIFDKSILYDDSKMGDKSQDFENLRIIGTVKSRNNDGHFVAKVRSFKNHKIYAMRRINLKFIDKEEIDLFYEQIKKLENLNHPHILKYHKSFTEGENVYMILEHMNNGDLQSFIKAHQILKTKIKEEEIWNILLQCLSALEYLRKENVFQLGIRITNIYLNNEQNVKLGLFYDIIDLEEKNHDIQEDIEFLGLFFYKMCYSQFKHTTFKKGIVNYKETEVYTEWNDDFPHPREENKEYSTELLDIVFKMIEGNINKRLSSEVLYNIVRDEYVKKYANNTSIKAVLRCLYSLPTFNEDIFKEKEDIIKNKEKQYISYLFLKTIKALSSNNNINECLEEFRRALASENSKLDCSKEVDPVYILAFILEKMHREDNKIIKTEIQPKNIDDLYIITPIHRDEEIDRSKENELKRFETFVKRKVNSIISNLFFSVIKTKRMCRVCRSPIYSFSNNFFFLFDVSKMGKNRDNVDTFNILEDGFLRQHKEKRNIEKEKYHLFCDTCLTEQNHYEFNQFYSFGEHLIICFFRGKNYENDKKIDVEEKLEFPRNEKPVPMPEKENTYNKYYLVGSVNRVINKGKDEFYYFARDPKIKNKWYDLYEGNEIFETSRINLIKKTGQVIILFYTAEKINK
jgi:serine/threonine protein kinase